MAGLAPCHLDSQSFIESINQYNRIGLGHPVKEIENHVSTSNCLHHPQLKDFIFGGSIEGCTPLLLACSVGRLDDVKHIVENWGVAVGTAGKFYLSWPWKDLELERGFEFDIMIEKATPLFIASLHGHLSIVRYLIQKGADLTAKTSAGTYPKLDGLTALHAPFRFQRKSYHPHQTKINNRCDIVRLLLHSGADPSVLPANGFPIWKSRLCTIEVVTELINHGLDLKQRCPRGKTLMHYLSDSRWYNSVEQEKDEIVLVKLMLEKGADPMARDEHGFTPILTAAHGHMFLGPKNLTVLDFLLERGDIELEEKIKAMELAGAIILGSTLNYQQFEKAFEYWRRAQQLRHSETDGSNTLSKTPLNLRIGRTLEWITSLELEDVIQQPSNYEIQAFLVQLRILSSPSSGSCFDALEDLRLHCYWKLRDQNKFAEHLDVLWVILETINRFELHDWMKISVAKNIVATISDLGMRADPLLNVTTIKTTLELILASKTSPSEDQKQHLLQLVTILANHPQMQSDDIMSLLSELVLRDGRNQHSLSLLHLALSYTERVHLFATVDLLLQAKANPNAVDSYGNTPLHLIYLLQQDLGDSIAHLLLDAGAHFDLVNCNGMTAKDFWIDYTSFCRTEDQGAHQRNDLPSWIRDTVLHLKCMSARVVRVHKLPFKHLPITLHPFIKKH